MPVPEYEFLRQAGRILNSGQSRSLVLSGNVNDLFFCAAACEDRGIGASAGAAANAGAVPEQARAGGGYVPLLELLTRQWDVPGKMLVLYELNGPVRFLRPEQRERMREAWKRWRAGLDDTALALQNMLSGGRTQKDLDRQGEKFDALLEESTGRPTVALEFLRQLCLASRSLLQGAPVLPEDLIVIIEAADLLIPEGEVLHLPEADRQRVAIGCDWFSDPGFCAGGDAVVLLAESRSQLNGRLARLPQLLEVTVPSPDPAAREHLIRHLQAALVSPVSIEAKAVSGAEPLADGAGIAVRGGVQGLEANPEQLAVLTAGLSAHALRQLLLGARYAGRGLTTADVMAKVEAFAQSQLGEGVIEFKKPTHALKDVIGFSGLKRFLREEFIPRCKAGPEAALSGAAVCGSIGGGKSFIFEAVAGELGMIVLVLKNIRSQWYGQTDVIFERLRRLLESLPKALILVDEADTQFGGVGAETHETERRLTGRIQTMMADPALRGRVIWLLMTARVHLLSPDLRRPGRVGDLIIPVLDPQGEDRTEFLRWAVRPGLGREPSELELRDLQDATQGYSAAAFSSLRSELKAARELSGAELSAQQVGAIIADRLSPDIRAMRRYQELQALLNCTRRSLLPDPAISEDGRELWRRELQELERQGCR